MNGSKKIFMITFNILKWNTMILAEDFSDKQLLTRLKLGDHEAFDLLYHQHKMSIYASLLKLVKSEEIAEELLQDVFIRLWEKRYLVDVDRLIKPYIHKIARNLVVDFYRKAAVDKVMQEQLIGAASELYNHVEDIIYFKESNEIIHLSKNYIITKKLLKSLCNSL